MKTSTKATLTAIAHFVQPEVYDNQYFAARLETTDEWIRARTGIIERRIARSGGTSDLIVPAAKVCLERRGISVQDLDCAIVSSFGTGWTVESVYLRWGI